MKKLIYYTELAILVAALYFTHLKLSSNQYVEAIFSILPVLIYRLISIYKDKKASKLDSANRVIIAELEKRLSYEMQQKSIIEPEENQFDQELREAISTIQTLNERDQQIINMLKEGKKGVDISRELNIDPATVSRIKKQYL